MASILQVGDKWRALVRRKGFKAQCKTFAKKSQADAWARQVEADMDRGQVQPDVQHADLTVAQCLKRYRDMRASSERPISPLSNEEYVLRRLAKELGDFHITRMTPNDLVGYARGRADDGVDGWTTNTEVSKLGTALRYAGASYNTTLPDVVKAARPLLNHLGLISGGVRRERRAEGDELQRVVASVECKRGARYARAIEFAVGSTMRRGEICRVIKTDVDVAKRLLLIRDRKHPRQRKGNDQWIPLLGRAWEIVEARLAEDDGEARLFPLEPGTLSKYFKEACRAEGIDNLRLHDMRHEGTSALFEEGLRIQEVALVTGHKDWRHLQRYTNLRPQDVHVSLARAQAARAPAAAAAAAAADEEVDDAAGGD